MGDVRCRGCGEPWDTYHLRHDVWHDMGSRAQAEMAGRIFNETGEIPDWARTSLGIEGWTFGRTTLDVRRCPCCDANGGDRENSDYDDMADALHEVLGDDLDAIESEMSDFDQFIMRRGDAEREDLKGDDL